MTPFRKRSILAALLLLSFLCASISSISAEEALEETSTESLHQEENTFSEETVEAEAQETGTEEAEQEGEEDESAEESLEQESSEGEEENDPSVTDISQTTAATSSLSSTESTATSSISATSEESRTSTEAELEIETGDATAVNQIINIVNSNFFNSHGLFLFLNNIFGNVGTLDLRELPIFTGSSEDGVHACTSVDCASDVSVTINNSNSAHIENNVVVRAQTGDNSASLETGSVSVSTGDSFAVADIVNVANTNVTEGGYLLLMFNNFGDWVGDLVFPAANLFSQMFTGQSLSVSNSNTAVTENNVHVEADSGSNSATGTSATVSTGDTSATANIINNLNQNYTGSDAFAVVLRFHGDWAGEIFNAPDNILWNEREGALELFLAPGAANSTPQGTVASDLNVSNTNNAHITNNVEVYALTGDNKAESGDGEATIDTGDAHAAANVLNVANTNVIGRNMLLAVINVFGDWSGNISFGRPDLWVGGWAEFDDENLRPGSEVMYHLTVSNQGDAPASDVEVSATVENDGALSLLGDGHWTFDELLPGETHDLSIRARVGDIDEFNREARASVRVVAHEPDNDNQDNEEEIVVTLNQLTRGTALAPYRSNEAAVAGAATEMPNIVLERHRAPAGVVSAPGQVEYSITIRNESDGPAYQSVLVDVLSDPDGNILHREEWMLNTILSREEIVVSYTVRFDEDMEVGTYTSEAQVLAVGEYDSVEEGTIANSAFSRIDTVIGLNGQVLGASSYICSPFVGGFIRPGDSNHVTDVMKLQLFLRSHEGMADVPLSGRYDESTVDAVIDFQEKYRSDVLSPWGLTQGNGNVLRTTRGKINSLVCNPFTVATE